MKSARVIVLANGRLEAPDLIKRRLQSWQGALVVAADGGSRHAAAMDLAVDVLIGDLDSLGGPDGAGRFASAARHEAPAEKDEIDLELALLFAVRHGAEHIAVLGALGGRLDMTLANVLLLAHPGLSGVRIELWHGAQTAWLIRPPGGTLGGRPGDLLSLIPLGGHAEGVRTEGLAYPLDGERLAFGPSRGLSNELVARQARVRLAAGLLLAIHTPQEEHRS